MAKYKYNDVILPALPEWDKEAYPFAVITDDNCLHVHEFPIVVNYSSELGTTPFVTCAEGISNGYYYAYNDTDDTWEAPVSKKFGSEDDGIHCVSSVLPIWSNHVVFNVFNGLNTVYLTGSEPVSVEDEDTGGDTEGGENEGDDTTGGENTDGAEPETPTDTTPVPAEFYVKHGGKVYKVSGDTTELTLRVEALEQDSEDINTELQGVADRVSDLEKGGTGTDVILVASEADLPDDAEDGTIAVIERAESEEEGSGGESEEEESVSEVLDLNLYGVDITDVIMNGGNKAYSADDFWLDLPTDGNFVVKYDTGYFTMYIKPISVSVNDETSILQIADFIVQLIDDNNTISQIIVKMVRGVGVDGNYLGSFTIFAIMKEIGGTNV